MGTAEKTALRAIEGRDALLGAWLAALNHLDNPMRRRAAKFRQEQRPRREIPQSRFRIGELGVLLQFNKRPRLAG
jgi:hypothetical protein